MAHSNLLSRRLILALEGFIAFTAIPAGLLLAIRTDGFLLGLPVELLARSPFRYYLIPGLVLAIVVGGGSALAASAAWRRHDLAPLLVRVSGLVIAGWISLQIFFIGYQGFLQPFIFLIGALLCILPAGSRPAGRGPYRKRVTTKK